MIYSVYTAVFRLQNVTREASSRDLVLLTQGFFIDSKLEFTTSVEWAYWIPPSQILHITKKIVDTE